MKKKFSGILVLFMALIVHMSYAQQKTISGTVSDEKGLPLPGVNVIVKNTNNGTQTDFDGKYSIEVDVGAILTFSFVGFANKEVTVGTNTTIDVQLPSATAELEEIVIVGYGSSKKSKVSAAITTVSSEDLEDFVPSTSIDNILQGQSAGVQVTAANGRPGNTGFVQIRGTGSINAGTTPLYIIDGIPVPIDNVGNANLNPLNNLNPNDIENVTILKDAASASKYGSRGANGVVIITTKKGRSGESKITFSSSYGFGQRIADPFDLMNTEQKLEIERQYAALGIGAASSLPGANATEEDIRRLVALDTDWEEELLRKSVIQSNNLSIAGGSDKLTYFFSLGYDKNSGIIDRIKGFERVTARLNTTYQAKDWLDIGVNVSVARSTTDLSRDRNNVQNPIRAMYDYNPWDPLFSRDASGNILLDNEGNPIYNRTTTGFPIALALQTEPENSRDLLMTGNTYADIKISKLFSNKFSVGLISNRANTTVRSISGGVLQGFIGDADFPGTQEDAFNLDFEYNVNNLFNYNQTFNETHTVNASLLLEYNENISTNLFAEGRGFPSPDFPYLDTSADASDAGGGEARRMLFSQGLFTNYDYKDKYIASASVRRDASSRFGPENRYATFYSGSVAWNISKESFMNDTPFNNLKLRVSYGTSGNQDIPNFRYLNLLDFNTYNGQTTAIPVETGNPEIQWESQKLLDIGLEFGLFNNRINGVIDYFKKNSEDLLLDRPLSFTVGDENNRIFQNIGEVENSGLEISLNANIVQNEDLQIDLGGNITFLDSEVKKLVNGQEQVTGTFGNLILREGEELNSFYLVEYAGVNPANGQPLYRDLDGNVTNEYSDGFQRIQKDKSPNPDAQGGFYASVKYKGFGLKSDFVFRKGGYALNFQRAEGVSIGNINRNLRTEAFNYWRNPGDTNVHPNPIFQNEADQSETTRFLESTDYLRLRTLTLDYSLPRQYLDLFGLDRLRFYITGQNIWTVTNFNGDPEIGIASDESGEQGDPGFVQGEANLFSYPQIESYIFGVEIGF